MQADRMTRNRGDSKRKWWFIVALAVLLHLALLVFVRPEYFAFLIPDISPPAGSRAAGSGVPDAIIAIQIDVEDDAVEPDAETADPTRPAPPQTPSRPPGDPGESGDDALESIDLESILGEAGTPRTGGGSRPGETIAPRPVEITWPETKRLKHCIGSHVDVRILVGEDGRIREVRPEPTEIPADCLRAALDAAARIKFTPGRVDGRPAALWAQVRIDFEEKR